MFFSSRIFSIATNVKQSRDIDGHGRDYIIRKMQVRKLYAQFKANCELKKVHRPSWEDESFIKKKWHYIKNVFIMLFYVLSNDN